MGVADVFAVNQSLDFLPDVAAQDFVNRIVRNLINPRQTGNLIFRAAGKNLFFKPFLLIPMFQQMRQLAGVAQQSEN